MAPDGNSNKQVEELREITEKWADRVRSSHIRKEDAWHYYSTTITTPASGMARSSSTGTTSLCKEPQE
eukprot:1596203-Ditylum_brightwellii.AAC.1